MNDKTHYNLYCLNRHCQVSIYQHTKPLPLEMNTVNFLAVHPCRQCGCRLVSIMDMKVGNIATSASIELCVRMMPVYLN
jgi:hypothetical protein